MKTNATAFQVENHTRFKIAIGIKIIEKVSSFKIILVLMQLQSIERRNSIDCN
jgi:hypothetical protein